MGSKRESDQVYGSRHHWQEMHRTELRAEVQHERAIQKKTLDSFTDKLLGGGGGSGRQGQGLGRSRIIEGKSID